MQLSNAMMHGIWKPFPTKEFDAFVVSALVPTLTDTAEGGTPMSWHLSAGDGVLCIGCWRKSSLVLKETSHCCWCLLCNPITWVVYIPVWWGLPSCLGWAHRCAAAIWYSPAQTPCNVGGRDQHSSTPHEGWWKASPAWARPAWWCSWPCGHRNSR